MAGTETVAVLGAGGTMGFPIARNLARADREVRAWNRSREKAEPLAEDGVQVCDTAAEAAERAGVIVTMLAETDAVLASMSGEDGALAGAPDSAVWAQMSTIGEAGTERCAELAREHDITFVDTPVLGTKQPAEEGKLVILASGPQDARSRLEPLFEAVGSKTMWVGDAGAGTKLKLAINSWLLAVVEGTAETIALTEGLGLDPDSLFEALEGGPLDLPYMRMKGKAMTEGNFEPAFRLALAAKDARLVEEAAARRDLDLPLLQTISRRMAEGAEEHGEQDLSATYLTSAPR